MNAHARSIPTDQSAAFDQAMAVMRDAAQSKPIAPPQNIWVYGAGGFGQRIATALEKVGCTIAGLIDRKGGHGIQIHGRPCLHPDNLSAISVANATYVHGLMNHTFGSREIADWAARQGFGQMLFPADLFAIQGFALDNYWLAPSATLLQAQTALRTVYEAFDDSASRALFVELLAYRSSTDPRQHPPVETPIYAPEFLPISDRPITFVDGGAYNGDTFEILAAAGVRIAEWIAFEPDAGNYKALCAMATGLANSPALTLMRAGLSDATETLRFQAGGGEASRILDGTQPGDEIAESIEIDVMRFDDIIRRSGDIYVKLDIEGAERAALRGMQKLIAQRPLMAISAYHRPDDLWQIPLDILAAYDRPRLRLRQHGHHGFDTVLYVMPG